MIDLELFHPRLIAASLRPNEDRSMSTLLLALPTPAQLSIRPFTANAEEQVLVKLKSTKRLGLCLHQLILPTFVHNQRMRYRWLIAGASLVLGQIVLNFGRREDEGEKTNGMARMRTDCGSQTGARIKVSCL